MNKPAKAVLLILIATLLSFSFCQGEVDNFDYYTYQKKQRLRSRLPETKEILKLVKKNDIEKLEKLFNLGVSPDESYKGTNYLKTAIYYDRIEVIKLLINYGVDLDSKIMGMSPYRYANMLGREEIVKFFDKGDFYDEIIAQDEVKAKNNFAKFSNFKIKQVNNKKMSQAKTEWVILEQGNNKIKSTKIKNPKRNIQLPSKVVSAIKNNDLVALEKFLKMGINPDKTYFNKTYLQYAVLNNNLEAVEMLIDFGASVNKKTLTADFPLQLALDNEFDDIANVLRKYNAVVALGVVVANKEDDFRFYNVQNNAFVQNILSEDEILKLPKQHKLLYNDFYKSHELTQKALSEADSDKKLALLKKALKHNSVSPPALYTISFELFFKGEYKECIDYAENYLKLYGDTEIGWFEITALLADAHFRRGNYSSSYKYAKSLIPKINETNKNVQKEQIYYILANSALELTCESYIYNKDDLFNEVLENVKKFINSSSDYLSYNAHALRHSVFLKRKEYNLALSEARILLSLKNNYLNNLRIAYLSKNYTEKLKYFYLAKNLASNQNDIMYCMHQISLLEQQKIDAAMKTIKRYVKKPDWEDVVGLNLKYGTISYWSDRQNKFYKATNYCIANYQGNDLKACFEQINHDQMRRNAVLRKSKNISYYDEMAELQRVVSMYKTNLSNSINSIENDLAVVK